MPCGSRNRASPPLAQMERVHQMPSSLARAYLSRWNSALCLRLLYSSFSPQYRLELTAKTAIYKLHPLESTAADIKTTTSKLRQRLDSWRTLQLSLMGKVCSDVSLQSAQDPPISEERLFLPSDYDTSQREALGITHLTKTESDLREGVAFDCIRSLQQCVKALDGLTIEKREARGQDQHTRASAAIMRAESL
jgi:hypothetical protein